MPGKPYETKSVTYSPGPHMGIYFMLLLSIYILYCNVTYIHPVSCLVEIKLFQNCFKLFRYLYWRSDHPHHKLN